MALLSLVYLAAPKFFLLDSKRGYSCIYWAKYWCGENSVFSFRMVC